MKTEKLFDLEEAIARVDRELGGRNKPAIMQFLDETEKGLALNGEIHYKNHFSIKLKKRAARKGVLKGKAWETPPRVEPEFEASAKLKQRIEEVQGVPCT